jgi:hypothetical protein
MPDRSSDVDPEVLDDLRCVEQCSTFFGAAGSRPEFWETFLLLRNDRVLIRNEVRRLTTLRKGGYAARLDEGVLARLREIHREHYPLAKKLREFIQRLPSPPEGVRLELAIVFIMSAPRGREAAARWMANPSGAVEEVSLRLRVMSRLINAYCKALFESRVAPQPEGRAAAPAEEVAPAKAEPAPTPAPPPPLSAPATPPPAPAMAVAPAVPAPAGASEPPPIVLSAAAADPPKGPTAADLAEPTIVLSAAMASPPPPAVAPVQRAADINPPAVVTLSAAAAAPVPALPKTPPAKPVDVEPLFRLPATFVDDLRRGRQARALLSSLRKPVPEEWRLVLYLAESKEEGRRAIAEAAHLKERGQPGEFPGAAMALRDKVCAASDALVDLHGNLRKYLVRTFGQWGGEAEDLALALILISPGGPDRIRRWMSRLEASRDEARRVGEAALARARGLLKALPPEAPAPAP